ncbi:hypothetical protein BJ878DRAFT_524534 [Calycina marina]|uniref:Zn(2)-C6 fungal-type domain-containing protein n=1 Tax=Calycina marina TaxID=1763456 RepID=A0A9P7YX59_9HELO|nr:hypothetical protein BJ878DRAFT_524534 [Calycina marina]
MSWSANSASPYDTPVSASGTGRAGGHFDFDPSTQTEFQRQLPAQTLSPSTSSENQNSDDRSSSTFSTTVPASTTQDNNERAIVPSACVQCRGKHLKCDGLSPCTRCSANSFECIYVRSRRGFKGPRKNGLNKNHAIPGAAVVAVEVPRACPLVYPNGITTASCASGLVTPPEPRFNTTDGSSSEMSYDSKEVSVSLDPRERCIEAFYYHFYPAHPFVIPRSEFMRLRKKKQFSHLEAAMRYVGSFYVTSAPTSTLAVEAESSVYNCPDNGFRVQAMLILVIGLDGNTFQEKALRILLDAQDLALRLGMNKRDYSLNHGNDSSFLEDSWRRTWWELYIVDGMIAGVHQRSSFRLNDIEADVCLPCEEHEYASGNIPPPHSMQDFDDESFGDQDFTYSSFAYRIAALRNLGRILALRQFSAASDEAAVHRVDAHLVNWRLHLPSSKKAFISSDGKLDEMLFQAHMITEASTILLHRELSQLDSSVARDITSCAPHKDIIPGEQYNTHAAKTIQAAQDISKLISLPVPLAKHTHFFTCVVTLASITHLSCWSLLLHDEDLKQQLRLNTGALKTLWQIWPAAGNAFGQVKNAAQDIFTAKKRAAEVGYWTNDFTNDEVALYMIEDQTTMEELEFL